MRFKAGRRRPAPTALQITSMIDVIFLLLIYFILSTTYEPPESQLTPALQTQRDASGRSSELTPQIVDVVEIAGVPSFRLGAQVLTEQSELTRLLERLPKDPGVIVRGAGSVPVRSATDALQAARDAGFVKVTYVPARR